MPKYNSTKNIPAKVFFEIMETKNYQLLKPKPKEKGLEELFLQIYDDYFLKSDNDEAKEYVRIIKEINFLEYKISSLKQVIAFYYFNRTTKEMREDFVKALKVGTGIEIDLSIDFAEEVKRVLTIEIGILNNDLQFVKQEYKDLLSQSKNKKFDYYERLAIMSNNLPNNSLLKENMLLDVYIALSNLEHKKYIEQLSKKTA